jgi:serine/threonine-protein kinase
MADSRYRITERVASGGMAEVFRGVAESLQGFRKNIAIKRVLPALTQNKKFVAMFLDEARLSLALQHANIVQVFDIGHADDTYFIVMEFVDGVDLKSLMEWRRRLGRRLPTAVSLNIVNEICKGLSYAHELVNPETGRPLGIVHRDVSPPNVLISKQGEVKVVDFGLAKASSQIETTDPGVVKGKMSYLSPEAARGEEVDSRADIFSVGILLYEMLTGKRLFYGETDYQTVELVRNAKVPPIKAQNPEVEQELEDITRKALAKNKEDRFQTATDLQDALAHYSYSRGLKVIARDVADLVRQCLDDKAAESGGKRRAGNILDTLLQEEINKMTSVDFEDPGAHPVSADELSQRSGSSDLIDPRGWADETSAPRLRRPTGALPMTGDSRPVFRDTVEVPTNVLEQAQAQPPRNVSGPRNAGSGPVRPKGAAVAPAARPTPGPEALVDLLEPLPAKAPAAAMPQSRKVLIAVLIAVIVLSIAALAGLLASRPNTAKTAAMPPAPAPLAPAVRAPPAQAFVVDPLPKTEEAHPPARVAGRRKSSARP